MDTVKTTYRGIEVTYLEMRSEWTCELFSKPAATLLLAKVRIDQKLDAENKKPFKRFPAFVQAFGYHAGSWPLVEVTSVTDNGQEAWCSLADERKKIGTHSGPPIPVYPATPENTALVNEIHALEAAQKKLSKRISEATATMQSWQPNQETAARHAQAQAHTPPA